MKPFIFFLFAVAVIVPTGILIRGDSKPLYVIATSSNVYPTQATLEDGVILSITNASVVGSAYSMSTDTGSEVRVGSDIFYAEGVIYVPIKGGGISEYRFTLFRESPSERSLTVFHEGTLLKEPSNDDWNFFPNPTNEKVRMEMLKVAALVADNVKKVLKNQ
jgi:predicted dehydrogenase